MHDRAEAAAELSRRALDVDPAVVASAPGRVNLVGGHTDYEEGFVLPVAVDRRTAVAASPRDDGVVRENRRVLAAVDALDRGDLAAAGETMLDSHRSLRDLYEVSCDELDAVVEIARGVDGVHGARMTGAGFGGSVVALAEPGAVGELQDAVEREYPERTGVEADVYVCEPDEGARIESS